MEYVIDANVVVKWFIPEEYVQNAEKLLIGFQDGRFVLAAPDLLVVEFANALWQRSTLRKELTVAEALGSLTDFLLIGLPLHPAAALIRRALQLAGQVRHPVYDMVYVALAQERGCEFITADKKMVNKLAATFPFVGWLGDL